MNTQSLYHTNGPVPGLWNDGKSAAAYPVTIFHCPHQRELRIVPAESGGGLRPLAVWGTEQIRALSERREQNTTIPLRLAITPDRGQRLAVEAGPSASVVLNWLSGPQKERRLKTRLRWTRATAAIWLLCLFIYFSGPALFSFVAGALPQSWEERLGRTARGQIVEMLLRSPGVRGVNEQATQDPGLKKLLARLKEGAPTQGYTFDLLVLDADFVNAFALPGGYMLVTTGLIAASQSPDELAGVLAHEMGHITGRHGTQRLLREQVWIILARLATGSDGLAAYLARSMVTSSFDRDDEREADAKAVKRLVGAGINPEGLADFFARLEKQGERGVSVNFMSYFASHPELAERRDNIRRAMREIFRETAPAFSPAMTPEEWRELKDAARVRPAA